MRINNNIMAMNTHRQLGMANIGSSKSMEKLSSGFRINSAADDAAGLAISEKMRGQIRGLNQAARNAQDGISLIQTAEGALNETHAILQRMRELAVQAANDTNADLDRREIQNELNQLTSEINRIGNTTEFNTQKLLSGGADAIKHNAKISGPTLTGGKEAVNANVGITQNLGQNQTQARYEITVASFADEAEFTLNGVRDGGSITLKAGDPTDEPATGDFQHGLTPDQTATALMGLLTSGPNDISANWNVSVASGGKLIIEAKSAGAYAGADSQGVTATGGTLSQTQTGQNAAQATGTMTFNSLPTENATITIGGKVIGFYDSSLDNYGSAAQARFGMNADYVVDIDGKTADQIPGAVASAVGNLAGFTFSTSGNQLTVTASTPGELSGNFLSSIATTPAEQARGTISFTGVPTEGATFSIGDVTIAFWDSTAATYADANEARTALGASANGLIDIATDGPSSGRITTAAQAATAFAAKSGDYSAAGTLVTINAGSANAGVAGNEITLKIGGDVGAGFNNSLQIGANASQSFNINLGDMRANALGVSGGAAVAGTTTTASDGKVASFVGQASVTDGTSSTANQVSLDLSTHEKATAAVSVIDDAINTVSSERSKLGAMQNRLEHTISNLGTSSENLQAAESRIRDVDMAAEMMQFTKNNILQQAATAMLAQGNQAPSAVLQLLG